MIPRMVYLYAYSTGANMTGYVNNSLSTYNISQIPEANMPEEQDYWFDNSTTTCRYYNLKRVQCSSSTHGLKSLRED